MIESDTDNDNDEEGNAVAGAEGGAEGNQGEVGFFRIASIFRFTFFGLH